MFPGVLVNGYRSFLGERLPRERQKMEALAHKGQDPDILLIGCCDSRVAPEVIFDLGPGEVFTIRNVANIVPPYESGGQYHGTSAAIEFAVQGLNVKHIVILGHAMCGGIKAFATEFKPLSASNFIGKWVSMVAPASDTLAAQGDSIDKPDYLTRLEYAMIEQSLANLMTFGFIRQRVQAGTLDLHGAHFGIGSGELRIRNAKTGAFESAVASDGVSLSPSALIACSEA